MNIGFLASHRGSNMQAVIDGVRVLNPLVTFLFKANKPQLEEKEVRDLVQLIVHAGGSARKAQP